MTQRGNQQSRDFLISPLVKRIEKMMESTTLGPDAHLGWNDALLA
jgi:hypothetical protein